MSYTRLLSGGRCMMPGEVLLGLGWVLARLGGWGEFLLVFGRGFGGWVWLYYLSMVHLVWERRVAYARRVRAARMRVTRYMVVFRSPCSGVIQGEGRCWLKIVTWLW